MYVYTLYILSSEYVMRMFEYDVTLSELGPRKSETLVFLVLKAMTNNE